MSGEDKIQIVLSLNEWNVILTVLGKQPYEVSASLIQQIQGQAQSQVNAVNMAQQQNAGAGLAANGLHPVPPAVDFTPRGE